MAEKSCPLRKPQGPMVHFISVLVKGLKSFMASTYEVSSAKVGHRLFQDTVAWQEDACYLVTISEGTTLC